MPYNKEQSMWQFSFRLDSEEEAKEMMKGSEDEGGRGEFLKLQVLKRCAKWHAPVTDLIKVTVHNTPHLYRM